MTRVLVTGARGFVGRHLTNALAEAGYEVHAVTSGPPGPAGVCVWHCADLLDSEQTRQLVAAVRAPLLVHLAWCAKPPDYWRDPANLRWVAATLDLVRAFAEHGGTRVVGAGTCAEYDWHDGYCTEGTTPIAPSSLYGAAKAACGTLLESYGREVGLSVAWARFFWLFGPHDSPVRLVPSLVTALHAGERARCTAGRHVRDFLFIGDAAAAIRALLGTSVVGPVNIASGVPTRLSDIAHAVAQRVGRADLLTVEDGAAGEALVVANVRRLREEVGFRPHYDMNAALDETVQWWRACGTRGATA